MKRVWFNDVNILFGSDWDVTGRTNIAIYSTPSLAQNSYKFVTNALPNALGNTFAVESLNVLYNAANNNYVMWFRRYDLTSFNSYYAVATSSVPTFADCQVNGTNVSAAQYVHWHRDWESGGRLII